MITALDIEEYPRKGLTAMLSAFRRDRVRVEHLYCDSAAVKNVVYERRRGKVMKPSLDRFIGCERGRVLCREGLSLPAGYRRFFSRELSRRLCENAALYLLQRSGGVHTAVTLVDDSGDSVSLCAYLADCTDDLRIVTANTGIYLDEADRLLDERGAVMRVCPDISDLRDSDIIIAPEKLSRRFICSPDAVILSGEEPELTPDAPVIRDYYFPLPEKYRAIKPAYLDDMYFASAMYTLAGDHALGSEVFTRCCDGVSLHTRMSLAEKLRARLARRQNPLKPS